MVARLFKPYAAMTLTSSNQLTNTSMIRSVICFFLFSFFACTDDIGEMEDCDINLEPEDSYMYPVVPGMPEWAELKTGEDRLAATQVSQETARRMSTDGLIETWLTYPGENLINYIIAGYMR